MTQQEAVEDRSRGVIAIGDEILNNEKYPAIVTRIEEGLYGIRIVAKHPKRDETIEAFLPFELAPSKRAMPWYGWPWRGSITLANGREIGAVCFWTHDNATLGDCEAEWQRTIEAQTDEPMQCRPTPYRVD